MSNKVSGKSMLCDSTSTASCYKCGKMFSLHGMDRLQERNELLIRALKQISFYSSINHDRWKDYGEVADMVLALTDGNR